MVVEAKKAWEIGEDVLAADREFLQELKRRRLAKHLLKQTLAHIALAVTSISFVMPFLWMLSTSLKTDPQIFKFPPIWIPNPIDWKNYPDALTFVPFFTFLNNTLIYSFSIAFGTVISCSLVAYSIARIPWPGRNVLFGIALGTMMIPFQVTMIPLYIIFKKMGWINTYRPLIVPSFFGVPFFIFLLRQFFMTIPQELSDAARIDGCSEFGIYWRIMLPLSKPALATVALFRFLDGWRDFVGPLIFINSEEKFPLSIGIQMFQRLHGTEWALLMAASVCMTVPIIILYFFTQRTFIQGITLTGLKG